MGQIEYSKCANRTEYKINMLELSCAKLRSSRGLLSQLYLFKVKNIILWAIT
jgi:hypothetical protein